MVKRKKIALVVMTVLTLLLAAALCLSAVMLYARGLAIRRESGDLSRPVFTWEAVVWQLRRISPLLALWAIASVTAAAMGMLSSPVTGTACDMHEEARRMKGAVGTRRSLALRALLYIAATVMLLLGVLNGGLNDVFVKAINICTECIGLG